jgi:hypothetical protein
MRCAAARLGPPRLLLAAWLPSCAPRPLQLDPPELCLVANATQAFGSPRCWGWSDTNCNNKYYVMCRVNSGRRCRQPQHTLAYLQHSYSIPLPGCLGSVPASTLCLALVTDQPGVCHCTQSP